MPVLLFLREIVILISAVKCCIHGRVWSLLLCVYFARGRTEAAKKGKTLLFAEHDKYLQPATIMLWLKSNLIKMTISGAVHSQPQQIPGPPENIPFRVLGQPWPMMMMMMMMITECVASAAPSIPA